MSKIFNNKKQFFSDLTKLETMPPPQDGQEPGSRGRVLLPVERFSFRFKKDLLFVEKDVYGWIFFIKAIKVCTLVISNC